jgi:hypothetical protein
MIIRIKPKESKKKENQKQYSFWQSIEQVVYKFFTN